MSNLRDQISEAVDSMDWMDAVTSDLEDGRFDFTDADLDDSSPFDDELDYEEIDLTEEEE